MNNWYWSIDCISLSCDADAYFSSLSHFSTTVGIVGRYSVTNALKVGLLSRQMRMLSLFVFVINAWYAPCDINSSSSSSTSFDFLSSLFLWLMRLMTYIMGSILSLSLALSLSHTHTHKCFLHIELWTCKALKYLPQQMHCSSLAFLSNEYI